LASESPSAVIVAGIALYLRLVLAFDEKEAIAIATDTNTNTDTSEALSKMQINKIDICLRTNRSRKLKLMKLMR
jgi:hypothetical protein